MSLAWSGRDGKEINLDLDDVREIEVMQKIIAAGGGNISARQALEMDGSQDNGKRAHFGRTMLSLTNKLEGATGEEIIGKAKLRFEGERVNTYFFKSQISVESNGEKIIIPKFSPHETSKGGRAARKKSEGIRPVTIEKPPQRKIIETVDPDDLPALTDQLLQELPPRNPEEVFKNEKIKVAADYMYRNEVIPYWTKVMLWLRYGLPANSAATLSRGSQRVPMAEILPYIPRYRGLELGAASIISSLTPRSLLTIEVDFIRSSGGKFPELLKLEPMLGSRLREILG